MSRKRKQQEEPVNKTYTREFAWYNEDSDDVPEGCAACGGPYPRCCDSCPLFDD